MGELVDWYAERKAAILVGNMQLEILEILWNL